MTALLNGLAQDTFTRDESKAALVDKYRPRCLAEVLGQPDVTDALKTFVTEPYPAAFLFSGETGTGKTSAAYALAGELGCIIDGDNFDVGGLYEIPSGTQTTESVKRMFEALHYRPLHGSGWRVLIVNECDRMSGPAETIWLDQLEHLPRDTVIVFTTNNADKMSKRLRDRCEGFTFRAETKAIQPWIKVLAQKVWEREGGAGECPDLDTLGMPTMDGVETMHASFRLALQQLQKHIRELRINGQVKVAPRYTAPVVETVDAPFEVLGAKWKAGERISALAKVAKMPWQKLHAKLTELGYNPKVRAA